MSKPFLLQRWRETGMIRDERVLQAFAAIPREEFVPPELRSMAYDDVPLPIGEDQTISQPTTVVLMLQALELKPSDIVLEVGCGSGYNAALLGKLCKHVYTTEIIKSLALAAHHRLKQFGISNVTVINIDGSEGYKKYAPYDKIILTAACRRIPAKLIAQLKEGGTILAPVGEPYSQTMIKGVKRKGKLETENLGNFIFVPLTGKGTR